MAIQSRRGPAAKFDPAKLLPGEWAVELDAKRVHMCFAAGDTRRMATYEEMKENIEDATEEIREQLIADVEEAGASAAAEVLDTKQDSYSCTIDLSASTYNQNTWYPITGTIIPKGGLHKIHVYSHFDMGSHPSWATNSAGYTCNMEIYDKAQTWGQADGAAICLDYSWKHTNQRPCGYVQMTHSSTPVLILRGGGIYKVITDYESEWEVRTEAYTLSGDTVRPAAQSRFDFNRATVFADIDGDVTGNVTGTLNGFTLEKSVPADAVFTDTVYTHPTGAGNKHIPSGGSSGQILRWSADGTVVWGNEQHYIGVCGTAGNSRAKICSIPGLSVIDGARVVVQFNEANEAADPTLNVNGAGEKPIYYKNAAIPAEYIYAGAIIELCYAESIGGGSWQVVGHFEPSTYRAVCTSLSGVQIKSINIPTFRMIPGTLIIVQFLNGNAAEKPKIKVSFIGGITMPKDIYYNGAPVPPGYITPNSTVSLLYDGTNWVVVGELVQYQLNVLKGETSWFNELELSDVHCTVHTHSKMQQIGTGMYKIVVDSALQQQIVAVPNMHEGGSYVIEYEPVNVEGYHFIGFAAKGGDNNTTITYSIIHRDNGFSEEHSDGVYKYIINVEANDLPSYTYFVFITELGDDKFVIYKRKY